LRHGVHDCMVAVAGWMPVSTAHAHSGGSVFRIFGLSRFAAIAAIVALAACASSGTSRSTTPRSSDQITSAEIASSSATNAYSLIERLRPNWLRTPGLGSIGGGGRTQVIAVFLDGQRLGDLQSLRTLSVDGIKSMQWLDAARAATVLPSPGTDPIGGAIMIKSQ
jgi:hypothetical protein